MSRPYSLLIRADAHPEIGVGHVMRCRALAEYWLRHVGPVTFATCRMLEPLQEQLQEHGFAVVAEGIGSGSADDATWTRQMSLRHSVVVLDGYQFDDAFEATLTGEGALLLAFDDYGHAKHTACHWILNQNFGATPQAYPGVSATLLLGSQYCLLRDEFVSVAAAKLESARKDKQVKRILVTMGGSDPDDSTTQVARVLRSLTSDNRRVQVRFVVGPGYRHHDSLRSVMAGWANGDAVGPVSDMVPHYQWADIAVCAGGSSNWEMSLFGIPRVLIPIADNQQPVAEALGNAGACLVADREVPGQLEGKIRELVLSAEMRIRMMEVSRRLIDGRGRERVIQQIVDRLVERDSHGPCSV